MAKQKKQSLVGRVRTRIAPSPTGFPHVGTAFQALFDWVYARRYDGQFLMRLEDTDQKRFISGAEDVLHQAFSWLDFQPDEGPDLGGEYGPYRQSERLELYQKYANQLLDQGDAYYCFCSQERLQKIRDEQRQAGIPPKYDRHCRSLSLAEARKRIAKGETAVIRMKVPDNQQIVVHDKLRGDVTFDSNVVDDQVLIKSDGFPTYHLAVVVDDHLMEITHVVRGEEWLPSAPKHILLYQYFNWQVPELIHTPTLRNSDKSKLSKRKGNTSLWWYREHGFLSSAVKNFLALMVWKPSGNQEIFSMQEMIDKFEWEEMNITGPIFDVKKLEWLNGKYLRSLDFEQLMKVVNEWLMWVAEHGEDEELVTKVQEMIDWKKINSKLFEHAIKLSQDRARTLTEFHQLIDFYFLNNLDYDRDDLLQKQPPELMSQALKEVVNQLEKLSDKTLEKWEGVVRTVADEHNLKHKDLFMSMRSALTARKFTPPLYDIMEALGWQSSFDRLKKAANYILQS